jgi:hypothetical protein
VAEAICTTWGYVWDGDPKESQTAPETHEAYDERPDKQLYRRAADAAILAVRQWLADEGLVVVPRAELERVRDQLLGAGTSDTRDKGDGYIAMAELMLGQMVAAAPGALGEKT